MSRVAPLLAAALLFAAPSAARAQAAAPAAGPSVPDPAPRDHHDHHDHHHHDPGPGPVPGSAPVAGSGGGHGSHTHDLGPAGATYDLRFLDAMVQHHTGALRMSELVFDIGAPGVGALAKEIWREQAREIRAMGLWRRAWYPQAPVYPVALRPAGDPDALSGLERMGEAQIAAMRMMGSLPEPSRRVTWFLEGMLHHHGGALQMAHDALDKSRNATIRRLARQIITAQRREILELRRMLRHDGLNRPEYFRYDALFQP